MFENFALRHIPGLMFVIPTFSLLMKPQSSLLQGVHFII